MAKRRKKKGKNHAIIAVSEGAMPKKGQMELQTGEKDYMDLVALMAIA